MNCKLQALPGLQHPSAKAKLVVCMNCSPSGGIPLLISFVRVSSASGIRVLRIEPCGEWVGAWGGGGRRGWGVRGGAEGDYTDLTLHCEHQNDSPLTGSYERQFNICFVNCEGHCHKTLSADHNLWRGRLYL